MFIIDKIVSNVFHINELYRHKIINYKIINNINEL